MAPALGGVVCIGRGELRAGGQEIRRVADRLGVVGFRNRRLPRHGWAPNGQVFVAALPLIARTAFSAKSIRGRTPMPMITKSASLTPSLLGATG
jgi:hypothetical protein